MTRFEEVARSPRLGVGISCEHGGGGRGPGLDALALREALPGLVHFLEVGTDVARGLDEHVRRWVSADLPTTYHFLDVNLEEREDLDEGWIAATGELARSIGARWLCGDAGLWHLGLRERGHGLLLPPILCPSSADEMADAIAHLQDESGFLVLPENPPSSAFVGTMHLLDYYGRVVDRAGSGFLLDCAHLAIYQGMTGNDPLAGLDGFPLERVVELHVAGGVEREAHGFRFYEDDHSPEPLPATWAIAEHVLRRGKNVKAVVYECEHNAADEVAEGFARLGALFPREA